LRVAFFCALREAFPAKVDFDWIDVPTEFNFQGIHFVIDDSQVVTGFHDKFANRGYSAILDFLKQG
jgi:hypothetical protein